MPLFVGAKIRLLIWLPLDVLGMRSAEKRSIVRGTKIDHLGDR